MTDGRKRCRKSHLIVRIDRVRPADRAHVPLMTRSKGNWIMTRAFIRSLRMALLIVTSG